MNGLGLSAWLPPEAAVPIAMLLIMAAGFAIMFQQFRLVFFLFSAAVLALVLPELGPLVEETLGLLPGWLVVLLLGLMLMMSFQALMALLFGRRVADQTLSGIFVHTFGLLTTVLFRGAGRLIRTLFRI